MQEELKLTKEQQELDDARAAVDLQKSLDEKIAQMKTFSAAYLAEEAAAKPETGR